MHRSSGDAVIVTVESPAAFVNGGSAIPDIAGGNQKPGPPILLPGDVRMGGDGERSRLYGDFDWHSNAPKPVSLDNNHLGRNPNLALVDDFSVRQLGADPPGQKSPPRIVQASSATSKLAASQLPHPPSPPFERIQEEGEAEVELVAPDTDSLKISDRKSTNVEVKPQFPDVSVDPVKTSIEDERRQSQAAAVGSGRKVVKMQSLQSLRRVALSKKTSISNSKSRLAEPPAITVSVTASVAQIPSAKTPMPHSPARPSYCKSAEAEAVDEDPFKNIEVQDKFRQGNFKALTLIQWVAFFVVMGCLICTLTVKQIKGRQLWELDLWKWFLLGLVTLCGRLLSGWFIRMLVIIFEKNFLLRKKVLYFVYGLRKAVQNCLWLGLVLMAWKLMFDPHVERSRTNHKTLVIMTRLLECFVIATFIWLVKLLLVKSLASSFHVNTFFDRIQESLYNQHVLEKLLGPPVYDIPFELDLSECVTTSLARVVAKGLPADPDISIMDLQKVSSQNVSAGLMKRLVNLVTHPGFGNLVTTIDECVCVDENGDDFETNSELEAAAVAKLIFTNVAKEDPESILSKDLCRFLPGDEVPRALSLFEGAKDTKRITKKALNDWVVRVYQERKVLAYSLNDTKTAVEELHSMASVVVIIIIIVVWLVVLGIATTHVLLFFSTQLLLIGFMFSNTVKQVFEAIIFLFVMHPFDVGDRCIVDGSQLIVEEMKILSTVFLKPDNEKVFYPNAVLATKPISNLYRSPAMKDFLEFSVHISTSVDTINAFKDKIQIYVNTNSEHWQPKFSVSVKEIENLNRMQLTLSMQHTINFQNFGERVSRRSDLLLEVKRIFAELGVEYRLLPQPIQLGYSMNTYDSALPPQVPPFYCSLP